MSRLVVGFGNRYRTDDGAGHEVAAALDDHNTMIVRDGAVEVVQALPAYDELVVVDAVRSGAPPGTVHRFTDGSSFPSTWGSSSHSVGVAEVVGLAKVLGTLPESTQLIGIEVGCTDPGVGLSPPVEAAVAAVVEELARA